MALEAAGEAMIDAGLLDDDLNPVIDLTAAYCWALDSRSYDDLAEVFTPDATVDFGFVQVEVPRGAESSQPNVGHGD